MTWICTPDTSESRPTGCGQENDESEERCENCHEARYPSPEIRWPEG